MFEKVVALVAEHTEQLPKEKITADTNLYVDLGWTSMDMVGCVMELEDLAGREIPDSELGAIQTVGDLVRLLGA